MSLEVNLVPFDPILSFIIIISCRPEIFRSGTVDDSNENLHGSTSQQENERDSSDDDDDGLPPLEANTNRMRPFESQTDEDSESSSDIDA